MNPVKIFGHKTPDTDTVVSAIAYAWYYTNVKNIPAQAFVLGELPNETKYVLDRFGIETPKLLSELTADDQVVIVDTNNLKELPEKLHEAQLLEIVDHHKLSGGITTHAPVSITLRPMASTASLIYTIMNPELHPIPEEIAGIMLAGLVSDTLEFRSPTTTKEDEEIGAELARIAGIDISDLASGMFAAKSDISTISAEDLIVMDSKVFDLGTKTLRVSVLETTDPSQVLAEQNELIAAMTSHLKENPDLDDMLLFAIDILNEAATPIFATNFAKDLVEKAFNVSIKDSEETILKGVVSRKKQIIPPLSEILSV